MAISEECNTLRVTNLVFRVLLRMPLIPRLGHMGQGWQDRIHGFDLIGSLVTKPFPASGRADPVPPEPVSAIAHPPTRLPLTHPNSPPRISMNPSSAADLHVHERSAGNSYRIWFLTFYFIFARRTARNKSFRTCDDAKRVGSREREKRLILMALCLCPPILSQFQAGDKRHIRLCLKPVGQVSQ